MIAGQVSLEKHMAARAIPLIFKDIGMELSGLIAGARQTMYFSNIGRITMPKALAPSLSLIHIYLLHIQTEKLQQMQTCVFRNYVLDVYKRQTRKS